MSKRYYGPRKEQIEQAKRERKERKPVRFGDTGIILNTERNDDGDDDN